MRGQRASKACSACATAKLRCAETRPCPRCVAKNIHCENDQVRPPSSNLPILPQSSVLPPEVDVLLSTDGITDPHSDVQSVANQLATPLTSPYGDNAGAVATYGLPDLSIDDAFAFDDALMGDFLRDIIYTNPDTSHVTINQTAFLPDVLDFGFNSQPINPLPFFNQDTGPASFQNVEYDPATRSRSGAVTPTVRKVIDMGQQAFKDSFWLWVPAANDSRSSEQTFLTIAEDQIIQEGRNLDASAVLEVSLPTRDRLLSLILSTCETPVQRHVLSRFPSAELISSILTRFVALRFDEVGWWIHAPTLHIDHEHEVFLAGLLGAAAVESHHPDIRGLGFAVQEAARIGVADRFEAENRTTRDLRTLQTFALHLHVGFWSGMRRKMEIAESFTYPLITMLRRSGRFQKCITNSPLQLASSDADNEDLWSDWIRNESFKRLVYHILIQDTSISMSLLTPPLLSPTEFQTDLPCSPAMWTAVTADEWEKAASSIDASLVPTISNALTNLHIIADHQSIIDVQLSLDIIVSSLWARVWQFRQIKTMPSLGGSGSVSLSANNLHQELVLDFKYVKMRSEDWEGGISPNVALKLEVCLMHLYVSLEDIQIFAGKEGESEARKRVPQLQTWCQSGEAREAVYHAGQALKAAAQFEAGTLRGFSAVAVYHASLVLWTYGILVEPKSRNSGPPTFVQLDVEDSKDLQRFLMMGQGTPCIADYSSRERSSLGFSTLSITNPPKVMNAVASLLSINAGTDRDAMPIVTNLSKLMRSLGKAASVMKRVST